MSRLQVALLALVVWFAVACAPDGGAAFDVVFLSLDGKTVPIALETDADPKDVKVKDRQKFKPSKGSTTGLDRRFRMQAKKDGAAAAMVFERTATGDLDAWIRVRVEELDGLVDDTSLAFFELRPVGAPDAGAAWRVQATWDADIDGLRVSSPSGGDTIPFPGTHELFLAILDDGAAVNLYATEAIGDEHDAFGTMHLVHSEPNTRPDDPFTVAFGVEGLGKKGRFYFAQLSLCVANLQPGVTETAIGEGIALALNSAYLAEGAFEVPELAPVFVNLFIGPGLDSAVDPFLHDALEALDDAGQPDGLPPLHPDTDPELVRKALEKGQAQLVDVIADLHALIVAAEGELFDPSSLRKPMDKAIEPLELAIAQVFGYKQKSAKKLHQTAEVHSP